MTRTVLDVTLQLIPIDERHTSDNPNDSQDDWLGNDDQSLLTHLINNNRESEQPAQQSGCIYHLTQLILKRSEYGFIASEDKQEYFLNQNDILVLPQVRFRVKLEKKSRSTDAQHNPLLAPDQSSLISDDIWAMATMAQSLAVTPMPETVAFHHHPPTAEQGNILQELGIDQHVSQLLNDHHHPQASNFLEQSPLDLADDFLRDDLKAELHQQQWEPNSALPVPIASWPTPTDNTSEPAVLAALRLLKTKLFG